MLNRIRFTVFYLFVLWPGTPSISGAEKTALTLVVEKMHAVVNEIEYTCLIDETLVCATLHPGDEFEIWADIRVKNKKAVNPCPDSSVGCKNIIRGAIISHDVETKKRMLFEQSIEPVALEPGYTSSFSSGKITVPDDLVSGRIEIVFLFQKNNSILMEVKTLLIISPEIQTSAIWPGPSLFDLHRATILTYNGDRFKIKVWI